MLPSLLLALVAVTSGWVMQPAASCPARQQAVGQAPVACRALRMQEEGADAAEASTEDLLDALAADEPPMSTPSVATGVFVTAEDAEELAPLPSYVNHVTVEEARQKWKTHESDTGSVQVQVAVLTARIAYMTKHMQENKKDYSSLL